MQLELSKNLPVEKLKEIAAAQRWATEHSGTYLSGIPLRTDEGSQSKVANAVALLQNDSSITSVEFKGPYAWATLDLPQLTAIAIAVGAHVQLCFAREREVGVAIDAGTIRTEAEVRAAFASIPSPGLT